jgi:phage-related minor tail protein
MASNQYLSRLGFVLALDSSEFLADIEKAQREWKDFSNEAKRDSAAAAKAIIELEVATKNYGKTMTAVEKIQSDIDTGKYAKAMEWEKKLLLEKAKAYDAVANSASKAGKAQNGGLTPFQRQAIMYQTTDTVTSLMGGQNPLMVLMQQGGQLKDQFGGLGPMFKGIAAAITPVGVAVTAVGAAVGTFAYAMYQGYEESKKFNAAIALTGNYAGIAKDNFDSLAKDISSKYNTSIGSTKDVMLSLISTGQFTNKSLTSVTELVTSFSKVSGEAATTVADRLIPSLDGTAASAAKLNSQYHFLNIEQYNHIVALEKQGKLQESIKYTADAFNDKLKDQRVSLGYLESLWKDVTKAASQYFDNFKKWGSEPSPADRIAEAQTHLSALQKAYGDKDIRTIRAAQDVERMKQEKADKEAADKKMEAASIAAQQETEFKKKYGEQLIDIQAQIDEANIKARYEKQMIGLDKIKQLELQKQMETELAKNDLARRMKHDPQISGQIEALEKAKNAEKEINLAKQQSDIARDELEQFKKKAVAESDALDKEKERLAFYKENIMLSETDLQISLSRLKTRQEIAEIERDQKLNGDPDRKKAAEDELRMIQKKRESVIQQAAELKMLQDMHNSVFNNMTSALDNFVRTGKFAFKDFARSVIQDLIAIALKAQMLQMFKMAGNWWSSSSVGGTTGPDNIDVGGGWSPAGNITASAVGGPLNAGQPSIVGENGPELFVPRNAGTIVPNSGDLSGVGMGTTINYNGPFIQSMSAIDTQSGIQFLTKNKQAVWAANQSAQRSLPVSR